jgi:hypothetical protein
MQIQYMADTTLGYRVIHEARIVGHLIRSKNGEGWIIALIGAAPFEVDCLLDEARRKCEMRYYQMWSGGCPATAGAS